MDRFERQLADYATQTNDALRDLLRVRGDCPQIVVVDAMRHSLLDAGKRVRAALALEFGRLTGANREAAMACACALEMVHAYSLIHDDLPCMDDDDFRRGKPSCHRAFGEANALLAGAPMPDDRRARAVVVLSEAAGVYGMIGGQVLDLAAEETPVALGELERLYSLKTGALLRAAARLGCIAGGGPEAMFGTADAYTRALGLLFQITDDILDVTGDADKLGKPTGSDSQNHKTTYVSLLGIGEAKRRAAALAEEAAQSVADVQDNGFLLWMARMILDRDH